VSRCGAPAPLNSLGSFGDVFDAFVHMPDIEVLFGFAFAVLGAHPIGECGLKPFLKKFVVST